MQSVSSCFLSGLDCEKFCFVAFWVYFKQSRCAKTDSGSGQLAVKGLNRRHGLRAVSCTGCIKPR